MTGQFIRTQLTAAAILTAYRPGSYDPPWDWADEARSVMTHDRWGDLLTSIELYGYENREDCPILGHDGRVWDGHQRIVAMLLLHPDTPFDVEVWTA